MASQRRLLRTDRLLDRACAGLLVIGALGDLFASFYYLAEIVQLHEALRTAGKRVENLDPAAALPTVYVLGGFTLAFGILFGLIAFLILRASPLGQAALRGGVTVILPGALLSYLGSYIRYQEYAETVPPGTRDPAYRVAIVGQVLGGGVGTTAAAGALLVLLGAALVRWFRPGVDAGPAVPLGSSAGAINVARILALAGTVVALLVPVAWVRPVGGGGDLPTEWTLLATLSGFLAIGALAAAGACILAKPGHLLFRWLAVGITALVAAAQWTVTLWQSFYAEVAYGPDRVAGAAVGWTAAVVCGLISSGLLTAVVVALLLPRPVEEPDPEAPGSGPSGKGGATVTRRGDGPPPERLGESSAEPAWQAFPETKKARKKKKRPATRKAGPGRASR